MDKRGTILIVDDASDSLTLLTETLSAAGFSVRAADSGDLSAASIDAKPHGLILQVQPTERREQCELLSLQSILELSLNEIYVFDVDTLKFSHVSRSALANLGYSMEQMREMTPLDLTEFSSETYLDLIEALKQKTINMARFETVHRRSDGSPYPAGVHMQLVETGAVRCFLSMIYDITDRKQAEERLVRSEEEFRKLSMEFHGLLDAIPDSLMLLDRDLKLLWVNKSSIESLSLTSDTISDQFCYGLWHNRSTPCDPCPAMHSFATGKSRNETITRPDGSIWDIRTVPLTDEQGKVVNVIEVSRDVTEHRKLEEQLRQSQKMESVGTLAGGIAHDFNNILTAIIGYGQLSIMNMQEDNPLRHNIDCMLQGADRAANLTRELLMFSRKQAIDKKPSNLNEVVARVKKFLEKVIGEDIALQTILHESPIMVLADDHQLEQVMMNLATNARDSMVGGGALTVTTGTALLDSDFVSAQGYGNPGDYALLTFEDTGLGMDEATKERVFEPFFTTKEVGKGTGLGLAVTYGIIMQHDGYIVLHSQQGIGTTFRIYLPLVPSEAGEEPQKLLEEAPAGGTETILLAEDDEAVRVLTKRLLTESGYKVIEAVDGADAVRRFSGSKENIDLLLFDLIMPKMNGKEAFDEINRVRPEIKVIFSSGYAPETIRQKAALTDGANLITKPVSPTELLRKVRLVLDGKL
jgi:PAS domain S-box-containing protein